MADLYAVRSTPLPGGGEQVTVDAGKYRTLPEDGRVVFEHRIVVYVSRTGRSVRVWYDGEEVTPGG